MATQNTTTNTNTLIATFATYSIARQAARELEEIGVSSDSIHIDSTQKTAGAGSSGGYQTEEHKDDNQESGFSSWWHSLFGSDHDDKERTSYESALSSGQAILRATVPAEEVDESTDILNRLGAVDVDNRGGATSSSDTSREREEATRSGENRGPIQVIEEELQVGKRAVRRGGVRVYSHVVSQPVEQQINLREEHVNVQRRPVDREISPEEVSALRDQTIEVTETSEEPVVSKRARVREEVVVNKEATNRTETVRDNIRRTEVEVEQLGAESTAATNRTTDDASTWDASSGRDTAAVRDTSVGKTGARTGRTGMSPNSPAPSALSGFGSTAGAGTLAGESTAGTSNDLSSSYSREFERGYGSDSNFDDSTIDQNAYQYGSRWAADPRYSGKSWSDVEGDLRSDYELNNPGSTWDKMKNSVRSGWDKATGKR